jgi:hypothetical protein
LQISLEKLENLFYLESGYLVMEPNKAENSSNVLNICHFWLVLKLDELEFFAFCVVGLTIDRTMAELSNVMGDCGKGSIHGNSGHKQILFHVHIQEFGLP